jgi:hypothetical protein
MWEDLEIMGATPPKCRMFLWLVAHTPCWTVDRRARRGLPHLDKCPLCDQEDETL